MDKIRCTRCGRALTSDHFHKRDDRTGFFAWCLFCMDKEGRSMDYPPEKERGAGVIHVNYSSLRPGYNDGQSDY